VADKTWKAFERRVAKAVGGTRRGADFRNREASGGMDDIKHDSLSIEVKLLSKVSWCDMLAAVKQCEANAPAGKLPLAILKKKGGQDKDALVVMRFERFIELQDQHKPTITDAFEEGVDPDAPDRTVEPNLFDPQVLTRKEQENEN
jgi:hypothetical protein